MGLKEMETRYDETGWYIRTAKGEDHYLAWAKREAFVADDMMSEPGDVYFEFGVTRRRAIERLLDSLK